MVIVDERLEGATDHLVAKMTGRIETRDPGRKALLHAKVSPFPRHFLALPDQAGGLARHRALTRVSHGPDVKVDVPGEIEAPGNRSLHLGDTLLIHRVATALKNV